MGVYIGASTKIIDKSGEIFFGKIPPYSVVVLVLFQEKNCQMENQVQVFIVL